MVETITDACHSVIVSTI